MKETLKPTLSPRACRAAPGPVPGVGDPASFDLGLGARVQSAVDLVLARRPEGSTRITRSLLRILVYAYASDLYSSRRIYGELVMDADVALVCRALRITDRTLRDFRRTHLGLLRECLARVLDPGEGRAGGDPPPVPSPAGLIAADWRLGMAACTDAAGAS